MCYSVECYFILITLVISIHLYQFKLNFKLTVWKPSIYMWVFTCTAPQLCCQSHCESEEGKAVKSQL